ncbi:metal-dependent transcriptional regulator [Dubosiella newyorkensis]|uniref:metal-dependent transcriptional regulator n=1 Tax=Dubosiella newyorkensis TaxID=1862672 RepID=UPI00272A5359|nr:iron dependent repressor, metal binding and dimerization domain protein [Dubosiella newyorkensis]
MHKGVKIALDPSPVQIVLLRKHAGTARFVYNYLLAYIQEEYDKGNKVSTNFYQLRTEKGEAKALEIYERHQVIAEYLEKVVGVDPETADQDACHMEHILSDQTFDGIKRLLKEAKEA